MVAECINFKAYGKVIEAFMARCAEVLKACRDRKLLWSSFQYLRAMLLFCGLDIIAEKLWAQVFFRFIVF